MTTITIEGMEFPVRATPLAKLMKVLEVLSTQGIDTPVGVEAMTEALFHGIRRAKGEITLEWLSENIDFLNKETVFAVFAEINGLKRKDAASGEAAAGPVS